MAILIEGLVVPTGQPTTAGDSYQRSQVPQQGPNGRSDDQGLQARTYPNLISLQSQTTKHIQPQSLNHREPGIPDLRKNEETDSKLLLLPRI